MSSSALTTATTALNAAAEAMTVIGEHNEDIEKSKAAVAFNAAEEKIEECFKTYNVSLVLPSSALSDRSYNIR